jgi:GTPase SAR1 family protein
MSEINYKVILLGDPGSGKTSLFKKLYSGVFSEKTISTIGLLSFRSYDLNLDVNKNGKKKKIRIFK